jgi:hypothetical protein
LNDEAIMKAVTWRKVWNWHLWLGAAVIAPLVFWLGTALVFALWPIEAVRGKSLSTGRAQPLALLKGWMSPPSEAMEGAQSVTLRNVEGHPVAIVDRNGQTEVWDLIDKKPVGPVLPLSWVREVARRDFAGSFETDSVYLFMRSGIGQRVDGKGPEVLSLPDEYGGPLPAYGFLLRQSGMHIYVDATSGDIRARRRSLWRIYDFAFRLHSLEFMSDGTKRALMISIIFLGLLLTGTGLAMVMKRLWRGK